MNRLILCQILCLLCRQNNITVIWQNIDVFRRNFLNRTKNILSTRIHRLTAFNHFIHTKFMEQIRKSISDRNTDKTIFFKFHFLFFLFLLFCHLAGIFDDTLVMFFAHIINFHACQRTIGKRFLNRKTRVVCVHMNFNNFLIGNTDNRITNGFQKCLKFHFFFPSKWLFKHNDKLGAVAKFNIRLSNNAGICSHAWFLNRSGSRFHIDFHFLANQRGICTFQHGNKTLSTRIHNTGLF